MAAALKEIEAAAQQGQANRPPTVSAAIADAVIVNQSGTLEVSLIGVFSDADNDALTIAAASSDASGRRGQLDAQEASGDEVHNSLASGLSVPGHQDGTCISKTAVQKATGECPVSSGHLFDSLDAGETYKIRVRAANPAGRGPVCVQRVTIPTE